MSTFELKANKWNVYYTQSILALGELLRYDGESATRNAQVEEINVHVNYPQGTQGREKHA